jgi:hypothetical protein
MGHLQRSSHWSGTPLVGLWEVPVSTAVENPSPLLLAQKMPDSAPFMPSRLLFHLFTSEKISMSKVSKILATTYSTALCYSTYIRRREYNDNEAVYVRVGLFRFFFPHVSLEII